MSGPNQIPMAEKKYIFNWLPWTKHFTQSFISFYLSVFKPKNNMWCNEIAQWMVEWLLLSWWSIVMLRDFYAHIISTVTSAQAFTQKQTYSRKLSNGHLFWRQQGFGKKCNCLSSINTKQAKPSWHFLRNWQNFSVHCPSSHLWSETDQNVLSHSYSRSIIKVASQSAFKSEAITLALFSQLVAIK